MNKVIVIAENKSELRKYNRLFALMLKDDLTIDSLGVLKTNDFVITFLEKAPYKGYRADIVLNLTQDKEYDEKIVKNMTANSFSAMTKEMKEILGVINYEG